MKSTIIVLALTTSYTEAFVPTTTTPQSKVTSTQLQFGIPTFGAGKNNDDNDESKNKENAIPEKKIGLSGLAQLITAGMGSPFLGDFEGVDEETGKFMFSLEANNLVDEVNKCNDFFLYHGSNLWIVLKDYCIKIYNYEGIYANAINDIHSCFLMFATQQWCKGGKE